MQSYICTLCIVKLSIDLDEKYFVNALFVSCFLSICLTRMNTGSTDAIKTFKKLWVIIN